MSNTNRYFFIIDLKEGEIPPLVNCLKILADPKQWNEAHITVKGPYKTNQKKIFENDNKILKPGIQLSILGVGNFFNENQNTVYLKCEKHEILQSIWETKTNRTFKNFNPHITICDNKDKEFSEEIFRIINNYNIKFVVNIEKLNLYSSKDKYKLFNLRDNISYLKLNDILGENINSKNIDKISKENRLKYIEKICEEIIRIINIENM